jgi:hypothetical protein
MRGLLACGLFVCANACGGGGGGGGDIDARGVDAPAGPAATAHFDPPAPMSGGAWAAVPYPSDLYLDATGHVALTGLPVGPAAQQGNIDMLTEGLATLDGAGATSNVYFPIDGPLAKASVTADVATLYNLDASTTGNLVEIPADVLWRDDLQTVVLAPRVGNVLRAGTRYGAVLTSAATDPNGLPLQAAADFATIVNFTATPTDPALAAAQTSLRPLFDLLPAADKANVVSATVFRTATYVDDTRAMRDVIVAAASPTVTVDAVYGPAETGTNGLQALFGVAPADGQPGGDVNGVGAEPHNHVAVVIHGTIQLPMFLSANPGEDGFPTKNGATWMIKGTQPVKFTLTLPRNSTWANLPVAIYVHGLGRTREDLLVMANTAARQGVAVIGIDLNKHGSRALNPSDTMNEMLNTTGADGFGDGVPIGLFAPIQFFHLLGTSGGIPAGHPRALGENLRQAALEVVALADYVADGSTSAINTAVAPLTGLPDTVTFRNDTALITESLGAMIADVAITIEPRISTAYVSSAAAGLPFPAMMHSPNYGATFLSVLTTPFGLDGRVVLYDAEKDARFDPIVNLFDSVVERGDALAYAPHTLDGSKRGGTPPDMISTMSWGDVWVSNDSTEGLAAAMGLRFMPTVSPTAPSQPVRYAAMATVASPVTANLAGGRTGAFLVWNPAGHACLRKTAEERNYQPIFPPVVAQSPPEQIPDTQEGPIHELLGELLADFAASRVLTINDPYAD